MSQRQQPNTLVAEAVRARCGVPVFRASYCQSCAQVFCAPMSGFDPLPASPFTWYGKWLVENA
eukprot:6943981-Prorocentrum_lima.AAC.1